MAVAPAATRTRSRAAASLADDGGGSQQADATGPAFAAVFAALLAAFALLTGRWLRFSLRRRANPPRHAYRAPLPAPSHRRLRNADDDWLI
ncbi:MAG: hypothetical protein ACTHJW_03805 [Streptosporangiaceae bacterium]